MGPRSRPGRLGPRCHRRAVAVGDGRLRRRRADGPQRRRRRRRRSPDEATGRWYIDERYRRADGTNGILLAHYDDQYVRVDGAGASAAAPWWCTTGGPPDLSAAVRHPLTACVRFVAGRRCVCLTEARSTFRSRPARDTHAGMERALTDHITALAATQHGLVSLDQLTQLGVSRWHRRQLVADGWLLDVAPRVYGIAGAPDTIERRLQAGLLSLGPTALVSHEAAARLHGFDRCLPRCGGVHGAAGSAQRRRPVHGPLDERAGRRRPGSGRRLPCTSATRTILDLARARIPTVRLEAAIDSAVRYRRRRHRSSSPHGCRPRGPRPVGCPAGRRPARDQRRAHPARASLPATAPRHGLPRPSTQVVHRRRAARSLGSTSCSTTSRSWSRSPAVAATPPMPSEPRTPSGATSSRTSGARSTSTRSTKSSTRRPTSPGRCGRGSSPPAGIRFGQGDAGPSRHIPDESAGDYPSTSLSTHWWKRWLPGSLAPNSELGVGAGGEARPGCRGRSCSPPR